MHERSSDRFQFIRALRESDRSRGPEIVFLIVQLTRAYEPFAFSNAPRNARFFSGFLPHVPSFIAEWNAGLAACIELACDGVSALTDSSVD